MSQYYSRPPPPGTLKDLKRMVMGAQTTKQTSKQKDATKLMAFLLIKISLGITFSA